MSGAARRITLAELPPDLIELERVARTAEAAARKARRAADTARRAYENDRHLSDHYGGLPLEGMNP